MPAKQQIEAIIMEYDNDRQTLKQQLADIQLDTRYVDTYKAKLTQEKKEEIGRRGQRAVNAVDQVIKEVKAARARAAQRFELIKVSDNYQLRLANTLRALELSGGRLDVEAIRKEAYYFALDPVAVAALQGALERGGYSAERAALIMEPIGGYEKTENALAGFMNAVRAACEERFEGDMDLRVPNVLFALQYWNDDMTGRVQP